MPVYVTTPKQVPWPHDCPKGYKVVAFREPQPGESYQSNSGCVRVSSGCLSTELGNDPEFGYMRPILDKVAPTYRPFTVEELKLHVPVGLVLKLKSSGDKLMVTAMYANGSVHVTSYGPSTPADLFKHFTYDSGMPCGVQE